MWNTTGKPQKNNKKLVKGNRGGVEWRLMKNA